MTTWAGASPRLRTAPASGVPSLATARLRAMLDAAPSHEPRVPASDFDALIEAAAGLFATSLAEQTRRTYARRWTAFEAWVAQAGLASLPAEPEALMLYLAFLASPPAPAAMSTLYGTVAAVNRIHLEAGLAQPGGDPAVSVLLRGYARSARRPVARKQVDALRLGQLRRVLASLAHTDARRTRDAALIALDASGVDLRLLSRLTWSGVRFGESSAQLTSIVDGKRKRATVRDTADSTPMHALTRWQCIAGEDQRYVFASTDRDGAAEGRPPHLSDLERTIAARRSSFVGLDAQSVTDALLLADPWAARDRALLLFGFAGAFRRTELCDVVWKDLTTRDEGLVVLLRRSKTDPFGRGRSVGIPYGRSAETCAVRAMQTWRRQMTTTLGVRFDESLPCFVPIRGAGGMSTQPIGPASVSRILKDRTAAAGVSGTFGGRSLRAGFVSTAADLGIPVDVIARHTRHATMDNLLRYIRVDDPMRHNAATLVGL